MQMLAINSGKVVPGKNIMGPVCLLFLLSAASTRAPRRIAL